MASKMIYRLRVSPDETILLSVAPQVHYPVPYADVVAAAIREQPGDRVLDMGCGAGG
jgi:hypothetical protein